jgi:hypothetical protein
VLALLELAWLLELTRLLELITGLLELEAWLVTLAELLLFEVDLLDEVLVLLEVDFAELTRVGVAAIALQT